MRDGVLDTVRTFAQEQCYPAGGKFPADDPYVAILVIVAHGQHLGRVASGMEAKRTKMLINRQRIYPPRTGRPDDILAAAAPEVQQPPPQR